MEQTSLVVIGAGPYGLAVAAYASERGIDTLVLGRPMGFWAESMPSGMCLRSGPDWHFDAAGVHTFEAYLENAGLRPEDIDPIPIQVLLDYATWFRQQTKIRVRPDMASRVLQADGRFAVHLTNGEVIQAEAVVAAPGPGPFRQLPDWAARVPPEVGSHTSDFVDFEAARGARVVIVGGRQSAYEWAALLVDHGAERVDLVHRHPEPRFDRVSWAFVEPYMSATLTGHGWWRRLPPTRQNTISRQFWEVGRLSLEWWLVPRLRRSCVHRWPEGSVVELEMTSSGSCGVSLSNGQRLTADRIVFATGYRAAFEKVEYLTPLHGDIEAHDGFPILDESFQTTLGGLYIPGFLSTRDFGPFFGFTRGCPVAARLIVEDLIGRRPRQDSNLRRTV